MSSQEAKLALFGGPKSVTAEPGDMFTWPIVLAQHEAAVLEVLRSGRMSDIDIAMEFERQYARRLGRKYALTCPNGTAAILEAMYGLGVGAGDEVICPAITYWASIVQCYSLRAIPVFADIEESTLCLDPADFERKITGRTKAVVVVHYTGMPADMDAIMAIARRHGVKVLEDCSHAHGALHRGREVGTFGDAAAFSLMSGKPFAIGEGGIYFTDDPLVYERGLLWGHYIRHNNITIDELKEYAGLPCGGVKNRLNQLSAAFGLAQLELYPEQMAEIDRAMNYFCDQLEGVPGMRPIRPAKDSGSTKGGWYFPLFHYVPEELEGLSVQRFCKAVQAEGFACGAGCNKPLHRHPLFTEMDVYDEGKPTMTVRAGGDAGAAPSLPVADTIMNRLFRVPHFKHYRPGVIEQYANAYSKVVKHYRALLADDPGNNGELGGYTSFFAEKAVR